jgi:hypothetical protein
VGGRRGGHDAKLRRQTLCQGSKPPRAGRDTKYSAAFRTFLAREGVAQQQLVKSATMTKMKIGRNDPCHCGSGQKYKRCCQEKDEAAAKRGAIINRPPTTIDRSSTSFALGPISTSPDLRPPSKD